MISTTSYLNNVAPYKLSFKSRTFEGKFYNDKEEEIAVRIANTTLKDWPKDIEGVGWYENGYREKPKTNAAYQSILLKQEVKVPAKPPEYYRYYDKIFNTQRWKDFQKWGEYTEKKDLFEKLEKLISFLRIENVQKEKLIVDEKAKKNLQFAFAKSQLINDFLPFFNGKSKNNDASIPNAIMFESSNKKENEDTINWLVGRTNANYIKVERLPNTTDEDYLSTLDTILDEAKLTYKDKKQRTIIYAKDFDTLLEKGKDTGDAKEMLPTLSKEYKTTLIFDTNDSAKLDPITLQPHRVGMKLKIKDNITAEDFLKLQEEFMKANTKKISGTDGFRFNYLVGENKFVDLYLGCFGANDKILWLEYKNAEDVEQAVKYINIIKKIKCFKNVEKIQCALPNDMTKFRDLGFKILSSLTKEYKPILEKKL